VEVGHARRPAVQAALAEAENASHAAEAAHRRAREDIDATRAPLASAERSVQRLETEAKTIGKLLAVESKNLWPPVMDAIAVTEGYEKALGTANAHPGGSVSVKPGNYGPLPAMMG